MLKARLTFGIPENGGLIPLNWYQFEFELDRWLHKWTVKRNAIKLVVTLIAKREKQRAKSNNRFCKQACLSCCCCSNWCVILGWPFSILAFLPVTVYSLIRRFKQAFILGTFISITLLTLLVLVDYYYYGKWTSSVMNLLVYNVVGGGESHLYGAEGPLYYLKNGFNNFNFALVLTLPFVATLPVTKKKYAPELFIVVSTVYIWLAFMSLQPNKEERVHFQEEGK